MVRLHGLSIGCEVDVGTPATGVVHSTFERAVNLSIADDLWTLLPAAQSDGPFSIRIAPGHYPPGFGLRSGDRVHVRSGYVGVGRVVVDCRTASRWVPVRWGRPVSGLDTRLSSADRVARLRAWQESAAMAADVIDALRESRRRSDAALAAAVGRTVGRGPGLTPSGDDVLVGIFAVLASGILGSSAERAASRLARAVTPALPSTSEVSRHLLQQASRGLPGRALHECGKALVEGAALDVTSSTLASVLETGSTSGADACLGLTAACRAFLCGEAAA